MSQAVYDITQQLGPIVNRGTSGDLSLGTSRIICDAARFEASIRAGDLAAALELYQGPFADNLVGAGAAEFERWLDSERTRLSRLAEVTLRRYVRECEARGQWGEMCVAALKLISIAPLDEEAHGIFMRALWLQGDATSALRHYETILADMEADLPGGISPAMKDLVRRIRARPTLGTHQTRGIDREPPFVGREQEFQVLREAIRRINDSETTTIVISGEAGIGKSRLITEVCRSIQVEQLRLLSSRCFQAEEDLPYTPIIEGLMPLVRDMVADQATVRERFRRLAYLLPDFGSREGQEEDRDSVDPSAWRRQLFEEAALFLATATEIEPVVWVVDDVQWIDRASGGLIHYLSRRLAGRPFLLVLTVRNARTQVELPPLPVAPPGIGVSATLSLPLEPLKEDQIREIVCQAEPGGRKHPAAELAVRLSAGNPYYALEVLEAATESKEWAQSASGWDPLNDDRLRKVLDIRVSGLGPERTRLLQAIAVLERHARPRVVAEVVGISLAEAAELAEELYDRSLISDEGGRIAFTNDAMREYVYAEMNVLQRAALHLSAGTALEAENDSTPGALATHYFYGDDWQRSFGYAIEAAQSAQSAAGHSEAAHFAGIAVTAAPSAEQRCVALEVRADSLFAGGELAEAARCYEEIVGGPRHMGPSRVSEIYLRLATTEIERCAWNRAARALESCSHILEDVTSPDQRLYLRAEHSTLALKHAIRTDNASTARVAGRAIDKALEEARELSEPSGKTMLAILTAKAVLTGVDGSSKDALDYLSQAEPYLRSALSRQANRYFTYRGIVRAWLADWEGAEADFNSSRALAERAADCVGLMTQWNNLACIALERGDWGTAEARLERAVKVQAGLQVSNDTRLPITLNRANLQFYQGYGPQAAETYSAAAQICSEQASSDHTIEVLACMGLVALQRREHRLAEESWRSIQSSLKSGSPGLGTRERFKVAWFASVMNPDALHTRPLLAEAQRERDRDVPSYLKLLWLDALLAEQFDGERRRIGDLLKEHELAWFCHFGRRWVRMAGLSI